MNNLFKALNDKTRRKILELLRKGDMTSGDIAEQFDISRPSISHHLDILKRAELVISIRKGQYIYYSLNMTVFEDVISWLMQFREEDNNN